MKRNFGMVSKLSQCPKLSVRDSFAPEFRDKYCINSMENWYNKFSHADKAESAVRQKNALTTATCCYKEEQVCSALNAHGKVRMRQMPDIADPILVFSRHKNSLMCQTKAFRNRVIRTCSGFRKSQNRISIYAGWNF